MKKLEKRIFYLEKEKKELKKNEKKYNRLKNFGLVTIALGLLSIAVPVYDTIINSTPKSESLKKYNQVEQMYNKNLNANLVEEEKGTDYSIYQMFGLGMFAIGAIPLGRGLDGKKYYRNELKKICNFYSYIPKGNEKNGYWFENKPT